MAFNPLKRRRKQVGILVLLRSWIGPLEGVPQHLGQRSDLGRMKMGVLSVVVGNLLARRILEEKNSCSVLEFCSDSAPSRPLKGHCDKFVIEITQKDRNR